MKVWIEAMRLRTLPLTAAGVIVASGLAAFYGVLSWGLFFPMLIMALTLQVIANFADEYGDLEHGVDNDDRVGPHRGMQRGEITKEQMKRALIGTSIFVFLLIIGLVVGAFGIKAIGWIALFLALGAFCIWGAIRYTVGKHAYGYIGLGDFFSFFFFGIVAVVGGFFLYAKSMVALVWLPAVGLGLLVAGMINYNNMRDLENDAACGKRTVATMLGHRNAKIYHLLLVGGGMACFLAFPIAAGITAWWRYAFVLLYILYFKQLYTAIRITNPADFDALMKPHSLTAVAISLFFALCIAL